MDPQDQVPAAQGTEGQQEAADQSQEQSGAVPEGVQKRFDEMTARHRDLERRAEDMARRQMSIIAEQQRTIGELQSRPVQSGQQEESLDLTDPVQLSKFLRQSVEAATKPLQEKIGQLEGRLGTVAQNPELQEVRAKLARLNNPNVTNRVKELIQGFEERGHFQKGVATPMDAYLIAVGEFADGNLGGVSQSRNERGQFNQAGAPITHQGGAPRRGAGGKRTPEEALSAVEDPGDLSFNEIDKLVSDMEGKYPDGIPLT